MNKKLVVAVVFGGRSSEHEVSMRSAASVIQNLDKSRFDIRPIFIDKSGTWFVYDMDKIEYCPQTNAIMPQANLTPLLLTPSPTNKPFFDVVLPMVHGGICENGSLQGVFELMEIPYVGPDVLGSAIGMDKVTSKRLVEYAGILTAPFSVINQGMWQKNKLSVVEQLLGTHSLPVFVKPNNAGSSVGIHKVLKPSELVAAIEDAFQYYPQLIIEQGVNAREIEIAVLEHPDIMHAPMVSLPGEVIPNASFYSYEAKLDPNGETLKTPADLSTDMVELVQQTAIEVFSVLQCSSMARVDFLLEKETNRLFFNEINTIPGFTPTSLYPKLWDVSGLSYTELLTHLIELAIARKDRMSQLKTNMDLVEVMK